MKKLFVSFVVATMLLTSCSTDKFVSDSVNRVRFTEARNYFHVGGEPAPVVKKITSQAAFEKEFGEATHMGKGGQPTKIDFSKNFVIAYILPETSLETEFSPLSLTVKGRVRLVLKYRLKQGAQRSFTTQPFFLIVVDRKYADYTVEK